MLTALLVATSGAIGYQYYRRHYAGPADWGDGPQVWFNVTKNGTRGAQTWCLDVVGTKPKGVDLRWENVVLREYWWNDSHEDHPRTGLSGPVKIGDRDCGLKVDAYYNYIFLPTRRALYTISPCGIGNPEIPVSGCPPAMSQEGWQ